MMKSIDGIIHNFREEKEIDSLLGLLKIYQNFYLSPDEHDKATFLVVSDDKRGVYGGAVLYPCEVSSQEENQGDSFDSFFSIFYPNRRQYWTARICLCIGNDVSTPLLETVGLYQRFYQDLYKAFVCFSENVGTDYLTFTLRKRDTHVDNNLHILTYELWPNLLVVNPAVHQDGLSHGILSLKGNGFPPFQQGKNFSRTPTSFNSECSPEDSFSPNGRKGA